MALTEINVQTPGSVYSVTDHRARVSRVAVPEILIGADEMNTEARIQHQTAAELTCALDVMTEKVISVRPDMATRDIANLLLTNRISAVPVVDLGKMSMLVPAPISHSAGRGPRALFFPLRFATPLPHIAVSQIPETSQRT